MKQSRPKVDPHEAAIRASAQGECCTLEIPLVCNGRTDTTVYCHSNRLADGKGMGIKAKVGAYGCSACHDVLDGRAPRPAWLTYDDLMELFDEAVAKTNERLKGKGLK